MALTKPVDAETGDKALTDCQIIVSGWLITDGLSFGRGLLWTLLFLMLPTAGLATHLVGGQLDMVMVDSRPGHFSVTMTYYYNEAQTANLPQASSNAVIFRKSDGKKMAEFTLPNITGSNRPPIVFANPACALLNNLRVSQVAYQADIQLDPGDYTDPQGYYLIQQNCCRNASISNLVNPQSTPFLFYLEFPAISRSGQPFLNSSPMFLPLMGDYICVGSPFTFATSARDADGDALRYSLVSPLAGTFLSSTNMPVIKPAPYPEVNWKSGFGAQEAIPGSPALAIDAQTGILSVKASQPGLFVFSVRVEEFRNGVKIGEVRRDLQLLVLDCPVNNLPAPAISIQNQPVGATVATLCTGKTVRLQTAANANWTYQWSKNDMPINGATEAAFSALEPGDYSVSIAPVSGCNQRVSSGKVRIYDGASSAKLILEGSAAICKNGGTVRVKAPPGSGYQYHWFRDGSKLPEQTFATITVDQPGRYSAVLSDAGQGCELHTDTTQVTLRPDPIVSITSASTTTALCTDDSLLLTGTGAMTYQWNVDGLPVPKAIQPSFFAKAPSTITVTGTDTARCFATSSPFVLSALTIVQVTFDSIPSLCGPDHPPVRLKGSPTGGIFAGQGVVGDVFDPNLAGIGRHELTYTIQSSISRCYNGAAQRTALISAVPTVSLPANLTAYKGESVNLQPILTGQPTHFAWKPTTFLNAADQPDVRVVSPDNDMQYTLVAINEAGCWGTDSVQIRLYQRIWVPDAFTPNGDGLNDTWQLIGIDAYPQAQLTVYNRWGEAVYHTSEGYTQPFDGTSGGQSLPTGTYPFVLHPAPNRPSLKGSVVLVR